LEPLSVAKLKPVPPLVVRQLVTSVTKNHPMDPTKAATATTTLEQHVQALDEQLATKQHGRTSQGMRAIPGTFASFAIAIVHW